MPCFEPVFTMTAGVPWAIMSSQNTYIIFEVRMSVSLSVSVSVSEKMAGVYLTHWHNGSITNSNRDTKFVVVDTKTKPYTFSTHVYAIDDTPQIGVHDFHPSSTIRVWAAPT